MENDGSEFINVADIKNFTTNCFLKVRVNKAHSEMMADSIVGADLIGHRSHGVFHLNSFLEDCVLGRINLNGKPIIEKETSATAWVNGDNALGPIVGNFCMKVGIAKAKQVGSAIVVANNSNNFGVAANYSRQALKEGMVCLAVSNSSPLMLVTRAKHSNSGTNPISLAAPGVLDDYFLFDMATTVSSGGSIDIKFHNDEFLPKGLAVNAACLPETDGYVAQRTGKFLPLGSFEEQGSYKGSGLSIMIDILCGVLGGAYYSQMVGIWLNTQKHKKANVGHCFIIIDPKRFAPEFESRLSDFLSSLRDLESIDAKKKIRTAGEKGRMIKNEIEENGFILYPKYVIDLLDKISQNLMIERVQSFSSKPEVISPSLSQVSAEVPDTKSDITNSASLNTSDRMSIGTNASIGRRDLLFFVDSSDWLCPFDDSSLNVEEKPMVDGRDVMFGKRRSSLKAPK